jgi:sugar O-acyltransferase (sialic acid O-acetyltransferase NeuD family)
MKNLIIIGARGYGREIYNLAIHCNEHTKRFNIKGFLDDKADALQSFNYPCPIISSVENYEVVEDDVFICALGLVEAKRKYIEIILQKGGIFINLIHPTVIVNSNVTLGTGIIISPNVVISNDIIIESYVSIQPFSLVGHDCKIGMWCHLNAYTFMGGFCELADSVTLHTKATILPKFKVGEGAVVGAGSIVMQNVKPNITVFGSPAKKIHF